ncbi:c-type cytochrome [Phaeobacter gallaeciensis]|uniref:c-type cytochrome n=1 Tax=Phaeobacter gallaeciensis TaxID=60890 RepID=UPI00237F2E2C|nr:cytochrome c [Phaeobacter gallaeciensis]MDE4099705.1 cytochrome c [Phaeobacter gallaeciensis]MDE4108560.1 cytochrome c [Phaeobacter gallaeciensis]MDE4110424.1 cytochrome c [Phaeobacter gallaeciensis]MDE4117346.1 cytochrome c [Phaeobacter gallaeciensis]MDE4121819.1 cytochrome c [Phaeobacter gallaeciensis]
MKLTILISGAAIASLLSAAALAHGGATGIVKERMDGMGVMQDSMKVLTPMMQGKTDYDAEAVRREAEKIQAHAGEALTKLFPEGSNGKPSEAKPDIWADWDGFASLAAQLEVFARGLAAAAGNGLMMADGQQGGMMGGGSMMGSSGMASGSMMGGTMMGTAGMMGAGHSTGELAQMPADGVFMMMSQVCSACHTRFRSE